MFDFSFSEIALIGVVALVVIGPERLPRVARTTGVIVGRVQRYAAAVRADIAREVELSELRRVQGDLQDAARGLESHLHSLQTELNDTVTTAESSLTEEKQALMTGDLKLDQSQRPLHEQALPQLAVHEPTQQELGLEMTEEKPCHEVASNVVTSEHKG